MKQLILIAHNVRSTHNIGSLLRTADGLGITMVYITGYSPYPIKPNDTRLPHAAQKIHKQIQKTALGAETSTAWQQSESLDDVLEDLRRQGFMIAALEQAADSVSLPDFAAPDKLALIVGREVEGIEPEVLAACDVILEIPMRGQKESFNVSVAGAMALFYLSLT